MSLPPRSRLLRPLLLSLLVGLIGLVSAQAQMTQEQQADMLLASAKRAYNEKNHPFAAARFAEYLQKFPGQSGLATARYGLALCLLEGPQRDPEKALEQLNHLAGSKTFSEYPFVLYYSGLARRGLGVKASEFAISKPGEAGNWRNTAAQRFTEAAKSFQDAAAAFAAKGKAAKAPEKGLSIDLEWAVRSRCDQAEMLLRVRKAKEAREAVNEVVTDRKWQDSRYLPLASYYHGLGSFLLNDHAAAGRSLSRKAVIEDEVFGTHARYLLGRVHHLNAKQNEREEARVQYQAVLRDHEEGKKAAQKRLAQPEQFRNDPETRARLERLVKGPAPDHVARATFFLGVMQYEDGRFGDALDHFKNFVAGNATSPLAGEARLRMGFCQVKMQQNDEAIKTLTPVAEKEPALADQALYWIGKAQLAKADAKKPESFRPAIETFRKAAEKAAQRVGNPPDPAALKRRGEILAEMARAMVEARQHRDAINTYNTILNDRLLPAREDEVLLDQATAAQLAGDYAESDKICARFLEKHKESTLLPAALFRQAENSAFQALAAEKLPNPADRQREAARHNDEAIKRYTALIEKHPEYAHVSLARQALGQAHYRKGELEQAQKAFESIPASDRSGELASVSYSLADIFLRQAPARADDALAAGRLEEKLKNAAEALEAYVGAAPESPQVPDALLKLGYCQQRMAKLLAQPPEQQKTFAAARATYERLLQKYPKDPSAPQATFERAKVLALMNDPNGAVNELRRFAADPLRSSPVAPMALLHLSTLLRGQNKAAEAATVLGDCRKQHEGALQADKARAGWVVLLQYHHAVALREANKLEDARQLFDQVTRTASGRPEGWDAALRAGQCQKDAGEAKIADARKQLATPGLKPDQRQAAAKKRDEGMQDLRNAASYLASNEQTLGKLKVEAEELQKTLAQTRARMLYESAWSLRTVADLEIEAAREKIALDRWQKRRDEAVRLTPAGQTPPPVAVPQVQLREVPVQPAETAVRNRYRELIKTFPEVAINADARFELAEVLAQRNEHAEAVKLLQGALEGEKEPSPELTDRIKVRLAASYLDRGSRKIAEANAALARADVKPAEKAAAEKVQGEGRKDVEAALEQLQTVTANPKSAVLAQASYREAECHLLLGKPDDAIKLLAKFRDGPYQGVPGLSDRALLRLGGALAEKKQWDQSRQAYQTLIGRFGTSPWVHEARYGVAWAYQNLAQYDNAVNAYAQVTGSVATELAARAQLNVGVCRYLQKRYPEASTALLVVPFTYDYPDLSALALVEAARALVDNKQTDQAVRLLRRVVRDHAGTPHAEAARKRLTELGDG